jgi:hypothetical protein
MPGATLGPCLLCHPQRNTVGRQKSLPLLGGYYVSSTSVNYLHRNSTFLALCIFLQIISLIHHLNGIFTKSLDPSSCVDRRSREAIKVLILQVDKVTTGPNLLFKRYS